MKLRLLRCVLLAALGCGLATSASAGELKLSMNDGRVTVIADNVPVRQILQEWARIGKTQIVNLEKLSGPNLTLQLIDVPERDALDILLRSASGYIAAPRPELVAGAATYDRITIMATSRAPAASPVAQMPPPTFQRPSQVIDDSDEPINVAVPPPTPQNPAMSPYSPYPGQAPAAPRAMPNAPGGVPPGMSAQPGVPTAQPQTLPRPGMLPQAPQGPGGVPNPYQPGRPGGGGPGGSI